MGQTWVVNLRQVLRLALDADSPAAAEARIAWVSRCGTVVEAVARIRQTLVRFSAPSFALARRVS